MKHDWKTVLVSSATDNEEAYEIICTNCPVVWDGINKDTECEPLNPELVPA